MKRYLLLGLSVLFLCAGFISYFYFFKSDSRMLAPVVRTDIVQEVSASGVVNAPATIKLAFKNPGKIAKIYVKVGEKILAGQVIAKQDTRSIDAQISEMKASIGVLKAKLNQFVLGISPQEIAVLQKSVQNAQVAVSDAQQVLKNAQNDYQEVVAKADSDLKNFYGKIPNTLLEASTVADDSVNKQTDDMFVGDQTESPRVTFVTTNLQAATDVEWKRIAVRDELKKIQTLVAASTQGSLTESELIKMQIHLLVVQDYLIKLSDALNSAVATSDVTPATISSYKTAVNAARTNINAIVTGLKNDVQAIDSQKILNQRNISSSKALLDIALAQEKSAKGAYDVAQLELAHKTSPARSSDLAVFDAQIVQSSYTLQQLESQLQDLQLTSPMGGVVTAVGAEAGEVVTSMDPFISIISQDGLHVDVNLSENNVVNARVGQDVRITLDAFPEVEWVGRVTDIDPAGTNIGGSVYYKSTVEFQKIDERIKAGMTANVWIRTAAVQNVLAIPASAILKKGDESFVTVEQSGKISERKVETGIKNQKGMVQIISGLTEGEQIVVGSTE